MNSKRQLSIGLSAALAMILLVLDSKTALEGARAGVEVCLYTVIPALLPFLFLSVLISGSVTGKTGRISDMIENQCKMPQGSGVLLLLGLLGGYPVGAQSVFNAYKSGTITKKDAQRLLSFCNNSGPAFIFGILGTLFTSPLISFLIWLIQILSAVITGVLLPGEPDNAVQIQSKVEFSVSIALERSIKALTAICGWIILFKVLTVILERWILWILPAEGVSLICGILELTGGCLSLSELNGQGLRFILACGFLTFGGLCILMQTASVAKDLDIRSYIHGKLLQTTVSIALAALLQLCIFPSSERTGNVFLFIIPAVIIILSCFVKKSVEKRFQPLYNK